MYTEILLLKYPTTTTTTTNNNNINNNTNKNSITLFLFIPIKTILITLLLYIIIIKFYSFLTIFYHTLSKNYLLLYLSLPRFVINEPVTAGIFRLTRLCTHKINRLFLDRRKIHYKHK